MDNQKKIDKISNKVNQNSTELTKSETNNQIVSIFPELPDNHFFNTCIEFPKSPYDKRKNQITPQIVKQIIDDYAKSEINPETNRLFNIREICKIHNTTVTAFLHRVHSFPPVQEYYSQAQKIRADIMGVELIEEAENRENDTITNYNKQGDIRVLTNSSAVRRSELIIKTKNMVMQRLNPAKYAPAKEQQVHIHGNINNQQNIAIDSLESLSLDDLLTKKTYLKQG